LLRAEEKIMFPSLDFKASTPRALRTICRLFNLIVLLTLLPPVALISIPLSAAVCAILAARVSDAFRISTI